MKQLDPTLSVTRTLPLLEDRARRVTLAPVGEAPAANQRWLDMELASILEGWRGLHIDATKLDGAAREAAKRAMPPGWGLARLDPREEYGTRYFIVQETQIVGTLASAEPIGPLVPVFSLYVLPGSRGRGAAEGALGLVRDAATLVGAWGVRLDTNWTWGRAVRFYLKHGWWLRGWKRALTLVQGDRWPRWRLNLDADRAQFVVEHKGLSTVHIEAERKGDRLGWEETGPMRLLERHNPTLYQEAQATMALALASRGWPLIRSDELWAELGWRGDVGGPEALAGRVEVYEALARRDGCLIETPRIPGICYRDWDELTRL